jgi:hypothetical protein
MSRKPTGTITEAQLADGTRTWRLRFRAGGRRERDVLHERRDCACGCGGGWTPATARRELDNIIARVQAGVWQPRTLTTVEQPVAPVTFHEYASQWLTDKHTGALGARISDETHARLLWALRLYLLPFFAKLQPRRDRPRHVPRVQEPSSSPPPTNCAKRRGRRRASFATATAGAPARSHPSSMRKVIDTLAQILDDAVEDDHIYRATPRAVSGCDPRPQAARTFLEQDELALLLDAAGALDRRAHRPAPPSGAGRQDRASRRRPRRRGLRARRDRRPPQLSAARPSATTCGA